MKQIISSNIRYALLISRIGMPHEFDKMAKAAAEIIIPRMTWPALMFAANRNDKVIGRIYELRVSTSDKNHEIGGGVFSGKRWADMGLSPVDVAMVNSVNHRITPILIVTIRWEVRVIE